MITRREKIIGHAFAVGAAIAYGVTSVLVRRGVSELASPLAGASVALLSGTFVLGFLSASRPEADLRKKKKSAVFLLISGIAAGCGVLSSFFALSLAPVVVVTPLQSTNPLFSLLWARLFLGDLERITLRVIIGTSLVVGGVALITIGRTG